MSVYSVFSAVLFYNVTLVLVYLLLQKTGFVIDYAVSALMLLTVLATARLFLPVDMDKALVLGSKYFLPAVQVFLARSVFDLPIKWGGALLAVWLLGALFYLARDLRLYAAANRSEREYTYVSSDEAQRQAGLLGIRCAVKVSPDIAEPYAAGLFRPTIYLPDWELSGEELATVLRHEQLHIRSLDVWKKLVFLVLEAIFWWNPVSHIFRREFDRLVEISCDSKLMAGKTPEERVQYAGTLLSVMKRATGERNGRIFSSAFSSNADNVKQRFELILTDRPPKAKRARVLLNSLFIAVFILSFFVIIQPRYEPPMDEIPGVLIIMNEDNSYILHENEKYYLYYNNHVLNELSEKDLKADDMKDLPIIEAECG